MVRIPDGEGPSPTALLRVPAGISLALDMDRPSQAWMLPQSRPGAIPDLKVREELKRQGLPVELLPVRARVQPERCRGCSRCEEVCHFGAVSVDKREGATPLAHIEPALCRGCNLCTAVCATQAARATTLSPEWWGHRMDHALHVAKQQTPPVEGYVVLACQRRAGALEPTLDRTDAHVEVIRFRCVGQIDAAMLVELAHHGARRVLVAGCESGRCRFEHGTELAAEQVQCARAMLQLLGDDPEQIMTDWSPSRAFDRLEDPIAALIGAM
jgi:coenzyme F420-reducing hydrogenase delta subunit/ferredoxin